MLENLDSIVYGILIGLAALLGVGWMWSSKRSQKFENEAQKAETLVKVDAVKEKDDAEPLNQAITLFDSELDSDVPANKPGSGNTSDDQ